MSLDLIHKAVAKLPVAARRRFAAAVVAAVEPNKPGAIERAVNASEAVRLKALQDTCPEAFAAAQGTGQLFAVLAFRYGGHGNTFPIGVFTTYEKAAVAAKWHRSFRGMKYEHRIYPFCPDKADDDVGHTGNNQPCVENQ